jgi:hypothetical protein
LASQRGKAGWLSEGVRGPGKDSMQAGQPEERGHKQGCASGGEAAGAGGWDHRSLHNALNTVSKKLP